MVNWVEVQVEGEYDTYGNEQYGGQSNFKSVELAAFINYFRNFEKEIGRLYLHFKACCESQKTSIAMEEKPLWCRLNKINSAENNAQDIIVRVTELQNRLHA